MANGNGGAAEEKSAAFGLLAVLKDNLPVGVELQIQDEEEIVIEALTRHGLHLSTHAIAPTNLDPFKLLCWLGCEIIDRIEDVSYHQHARILESLIQSLEVILFLETDEKIRLLPEDRELLSRLAMEEIKGNGDHGIGFNGLFIAFHCLRSTYRQIHGG